MRLAITQSRQCVSACSTKSKRERRAAIEANGRQEKPNCSQMNIAKLGAATSEHFCDREASSDRKGQVVALKKSQKSLKNWTKQKWRTNTGKASLKGGGRYLPDAAWSSLSPGEKAAVSRSKNKATKSGKQVSKMPKRIARKVARHRK